MFTAKGCPSLVNAGEGGYCVEHRVLHQQQYDAHRATPAHSGYGARQNILRKDLRCMAVNIDPETGQKDSSIMKAIMKIRKNFLGAFWATPFLGLISVVDEIYFS
jgi:Cu2+-containing amine oxidase